METYSKFSMENILIPEEYKLTKARKKEIMIKSFFFNISD